MKIAFFGYDFFSNVLESLSENGFEVVKVFGCEVDNEYNFDKDVRSFCEDRGVSFTSAKVTVEDIRLLNDAGVDLLVVAAYPHRVPVEAASMPGLNVHPTLLPDGRGPWPLPWTILNELSETGVTVHVLTKSFDDGAILAQSRVALSADDDLETLSYKLQLLAPDLVLGVAKDLESAVKAAEPQGSGSYLPMPTDDARTLDWSMSIREIEKIGRAFGKFECYANVGKREVCITDLRVWSADHGYRVGDVVRETAGELVVAASDGLVLLREFYFDE